MTIIWARSRGGQLQSGQCPGRGPAWPAWSCPHSHTSAAPSIVHTYLGVGGANVVRNIGECARCADRDAPPGVTMRELCGGAGGGGAGQSDLARPSLGTGGWLGHGTMGRQSPGWMLGHLPPPLQHSPAPASLCQEDVTGGGTGACWALLGPQIMASHLEDMLTTGGHLDSYQ